MRYIIALMIALPLLMVGSLEADAGLVEDLRSGKSDVRAATVRNDIGVIQFWRTTRSQADFKAIAKSRNWMGRVLGRYGDVFGVMGQSSAEAAVMAGLSKCESKSSAKCEVYSVGDQVVAGFSKQELAAAIVAYGQGGKKTVTAGREERLSEVADGKWIGSHNAGWWRGNSTFELKILGGKITSKPGSRRWNSSPNI